MLSPEQQQQYSGNILIIMQTILALIWWSEVATKTPKTKQLKP